MDQDRTTRQYDFDRVFRIALTAAGVVALVLLLRYLSAVLIPFAVALLGAYLLNPMVDLLQRRLKRRGLAVAVTMFALAVLTVAFLALLVPMVRAEVTGLQNTIRQLSGDSVVVKVQEGGRSLRADYERFRSRQSPWVRDLLDQSVAAIRETDFGTLAVDAGKRILPGVWGFVGGVFSFVIGLTGLVIVLLYLVFLLYDYPQMAGAWPVYLPPAYRESVVLFVEEFRLAMSRYFRGQFLIAACVGVLFAIGFSILRLPAAVLLGLSVGALNMVPYLQTVGLLPALALGVVRAWQTGANVTGMLLLVLVVFAVVQVIQDALLTPRIMGRSTGLKPAVILLGVCVWGKLLGFLGLVLAIPLTCLGVAYYRRWLLGHSVAQTPVVGAGTD